MIEDLTFPFSVETSNSYHGDNGSRIPEFPYFQSQTFYEAAMKVLADLDAQYKQGIRPFFVDAPISFPEGYGPRIPESAYSNPQTFYETAMKVLADWDARLEQGKLRLKKLILPELQNQADTLLEAAYNIGLFNWCDWCWFPLSNISTIAGMRSWCMLQYEKIDVARRRRFYDCFVDSRDVDSDLEVTIPGLLLLYEIESPDAEKLQAWLRLTHWRIAGVRFEVPQDCKVIVPRGWIIARRLGSAMNRPWPPEPIGEISWAGIHNALDTLVRWSYELENRGESGQVAESPPANEAEDQEIDWNYLITSPPLPAAKIAEKLGQPVKLVERMLRHLRKVMPCCYFEDDNPQKGNARYMHKMPDVLPALKKWIQKRLKKQSKPPG